MTVTLRFTVTDDDTALALGSGDVAVLGTPRLVAWCEAATVAVLAAEGVVDERRTSVGTRVEIDHLAPTPVGGVLSVTAALEDAEPARGRRRTFAVSAVDGSGVVVGRGTVVRVVVERESFAQR